MNDGLLRSNTPTPSVRITQQKVISILGITALVIILSPYLLGCSDKAPQKKKDEIHQQAEAAFNITQLPSSYDRIPKKKEAPPVQQATTQPNPLDALLAKALEERMRREQMARKAKPGFTVELPKKEAQENNGTESTLVHDTQTAALSSRDDANRQDDKVRFIKSQASNNTLLLQTVEQPISRYQLMAGTVIPGVLVTGINSDLPGQILGHVSQNIFDTATGNHLLIPQGTKIIGEYDSRVVYGQERALIVWNRLIFPTGKSIFIGNMPGTDSAGYAGLTDKVNNHYMKLATGVLITSILGAGAQMANGRSASTFDPRFGELAAQGAATNLNRVGEQITERNLNIQPTIEIRPGYRFQVFVTKDIVLEPLEE